jgi:hypothetical protein
MFFGCRRPVHLLWNVGSGDAKEISLWGDSWPRSNGVSRLKGKIVALFDDLSPFMIGNSRGSLDERKRPIFVLLPKSRPTSRLCCLLLLIPSARTRTGP